MARRKDKKKTRRELESEIRRLKSRLAKVKPSKPSRKPQRDKWGRFKSRKRGRVIAPPKGLSRDSHGRFISRVTAALSLDAIPKPDSTQILTDNSRIYLWRFTGLSKIREAALLLYALDDYDGLSRWVIFVGQGKTQNFISRPTDKPVASGTFLEDWRAYAYSDEIQARANNGEKVHLDVYFYSPTKQDFE